MTVCIFVCSTGLYDNTTESDLEPEGANKYISSGATTRLCLFSVAIQSCCRTLDVGFSQMGIFLPVVTLESCREADIYPFWGKSNPNMVFPIRWGIQLGIRSSVKPNLESEPCYGKWLQR